MINVFAEQSSLSWEQHRHPPVPGHHYATRDGRYRITPQPSPWEPEDKTKYVWAVEVPVYGDLHYRIIKAASTFADAVEFAEKDDASPVWRVEDGDCRWCRMAKADLSMYPRWWFACNFCEQEYAKSGVPQDGTDATDYEYEPRHD